MNLQNIFYSCPECRGKLLTDSNFLRCNDCEINYPVNGLIVDFRQHDQNYFFNPISEEKMDSLIKETNEENWAETIQKFILLVSAKLPAGWLDNLVVDGRYAWKLFLDLNKEKKLLDIGCGLGNLVSNLAPHVGKTYAMDLTYKRLEFTEKRASIHNRSDEIEFIAGGDRKYLPFDDNSIDCVTLSGVLEWVGEGDFSPYLEGGKLSRLWNMLTGFFGETNPRNIQLNFLKEIKRVLKDDGQLFVGIENRLNYEYFCGRPDHHSRLKYGSLLPRFIANLYSIAKKRNSYRTYTYSIPGYKKLFKEAGFNNIQFLGLTAGYSFLNEILPAEINYSNWQPDKVKSLKQRIKNNKYFVPAYGIIASEINEPRDRLLDKIINEIEKKIGIKGDPLIIKRYQITGKEKLVINGILGKKKIIIKIPLNKTVFGTEMQNKALLEHMAGSPVCPEFLCQANVEELSCFIEEEVQGESYQSLGSSDIYSQVSSVLQQINAKEKLKKQSSFSGTFYEKIVEEPLAQLFSELKDQTLDKQLKLYFKEKLHGCDITMGISHGDLSVSNVFVLATGDCRLIDWEAGSIEGIPILDAINFVGSDYRYGHNNAGELGAVTELTSKQFRNSASWFFLQEQYDYFGMDTDLHESLVYLNWLHGINCLLSNNLKYDKSAIDKCIYDVAKNL